MRMWMVRDEGLYGAWWGEPGREGKRKDRGEEIRGLGERREEKGRKRLLAV